MSKIPKHYRNLQSHLLKIPGFDEKLSETLDDIGVNNEMVQRRRRNVLLHENIGTVMTRLRGYDRPEYHFGSQSEGATTFDLKSDIDRVYCVAHINIMQSMSERRPIDSRNKMNYLIIQGDGITPGYCHLEVINERLRDSKIDVTKVIDHYVRGKDNRIFYKNTIMEDFMDCGGERHGPAWAQEGEYGFNDQDTVAAFHCKSWPYQARDWLNQRNNGWPTDELKYKCMKEGFFVVPTGSCPERDLEWRISTSFAERQLMFSLNITQLRCYILMKMIIKTFMTGELQGKISSFMCKNVLLHCIESSLPVEWKENNLSRCLDKCLERLRMCVQDENCPHFIIPKNNLMSGKFSAKIKSDILEMMGYVNGNSRLVLAKAIQFDELSIRLRGKLQLPTDAIDKTAFQISNILKAQFLLNTAFILITAIDAHLRLTDKKNPGSIEEFQKQSIQMLEILLNKEDGIQKEAFSLLSPFLFSLLGSIQGSRVGLRSDSLESIEAESLLIKGFNSDVSSGRLRTASIFFCLGDMEMTQSILDETKAKFDIEVVEPVCKCYIKPFNYDSKNAIKFREEKNQVVRNVVAFCVKFLPIEIKWVPKELQYEMYRLTDDKIEEAEEVEVGWMKWAVVDSFIYLLFLQYKTYKHLHKEDESQRVLSNMIDAIDRTQNLSHKETALNILGQCMEENNRPMEALRCYIGSLRLRTRRNAAKILICMCLNNIFHTEEEIVTTIYQRIRD